MNNSKTNDVDKKKRMMANAMKFEKETNKQEKQMVKERGDRVKAGGFKSEHDYFSNVNPFTGKRRGE